jgi:hypothetical protein
MENEHIQMIAEFTWGCAWFSLRYARSSGSFSVTVASCIIQQRLKSSCVMQVICSTY